MKMLQLGFIFICAVYVNGALDACSLWLPEDLDMFAEKFTHLTVSLYSKETCPGKEASILNGNTYFFPDHVQQFTSKIINYVNSQQSSYTINDLRLMVCDSKLMEERYIDKLRSLILSTSFSFSRPVITPVDFMIEGCRIHLKAT